MPVDGAPEAEIFKKIEAAVKSHRVFLFMKGVPAMPQCGFSNKVVQILAAYNVEYGSFNVLDDVEVREAVKKYSNLPFLHKQIVTPCACSPTGQPFPSCMLTANSSVVPTF